MSTEEKKLLSDLVMEIKEKQTDIKMLWINIDSIRNKYLNSEGDAPVVDNYVRKLLHGIT